MAPATAIPNVKLRQAFLGLVEQKFGEQPQRVIAGQPTRGPAKEIYRVDGKTFRLRTNNKPCLMAKVASSDVDAPLPFEGEDLVGIAFPAERDGFVVGYLVPSTVAVKAMRDAHRKWLASEERRERSGDNQTRVLRFDGDTDLLWFGYAKRWAKYNIGEIEIDAQPVASALDLEIANARRRIAAVAGKPESAIRIAIDY
jgi:hypothetical protein